MRGTRWPKTRQDLSEQTGVYSAAQNLAERRASPHTVNLTKLPPRFPARSGYSVNQANTLIDQIAQLNTSIAKVEHPLPRQTG